MKDYLCLQYYDSDWHNAGGLYINKNAIAAIRGETVNFGTGRNKVCKILLTNGVEYAIVHSVSDVVDMMNGDI